MKFWTLSITLPTLVLAVTAADFCPPTSHLYPQFQLCQDRDRELPEARDRDREQPEARFRRDGDQPRPEARERDRDRELPEARLRDRERPLERRERDEFDERREPDREIPRERPHPDNVDAESLRSFVREQLPLTADYLPQLSTDRRRHLAEHVANAMREHREIMANEPEAATARLKEFDCETACRLAGDEIRRLRQAGAPAAQIDQATATLEPLVSQFFTLRQRSIEEEARRMRLEADELEAHLRKREANKAAIIKRHTAVLSGEPDPFAF